MLYTSRYRKNSKNKPRAYIFQTPFLRGLFLEGLIYGGKICVLKLIELVCSGKGIHHFCFVLLCI